MNNSIINNTGVTTSYGTIKDYFDNNNIVSTTTSYIYGDERLSKLVNIAENICSSLNDYLKDNSDIELKDLINELVKLELEKVIDNPTPLLEKIITDRIELITKLDDKIKNLEQVINRLEEKIEKLNNNDSIKTIFDTNQVNSINNMLNINTPLKS